MYNPIELPSLQEIEQIEKQRQKNIESLEISNDKVKCQNCNSLQPIRPPMTNSQFSGRIYQLQTRIRHSTKPGNCKKEKEEIEQLLKEEAKKDILRRIPLYSSSISGYRFVCSKCYDEVYYSIYINKKKKE